MHVGKVPYVHVKFILSHSRDNAFPSAVVRRTACGRVRRESCMAGWVFPSQHFAQYPATVYIFCPFQEAGTLCVPGTSQATARAQWEAGNLEDLAVTPHILSLRRRGLAVRIHTVRYARLCGLYLQKIERVFRFLFPLSLSLSHEQAIR